MSIRACIVALSVIVGFTATDELNAASVDRPAFRFDGREFFLRSTEGGILEYLPPDETFKNWKTLMSVREFTATDDPKAYAETLIRNAKASSPKAKTMLMENAEAGSYIVDFLLPDGDADDAGFEWNLWRIERKGKGIEAVQYASRIANDTPAKKIIADRERLVPELAIFKVPTANERTDSAAGGGGTATVGIDIVQTKPGDENTPYVVKNTTTGRVIGTFWNPETETSDFDFSSGEAPQFFWSEDRNVVAVNNRDANGRWGDVNLYRVTGQTLEAIPMPNLPNEQGDELATVRAMNLACDITAAVRWQPDGTLLVRYEVASRETDRKPQVTKELWADIALEGGSAKVVGTSTMEPSTPPTGMFPNPAPPAGETLASQQASASAPAPEEEFSATRLVGVHQVIGKNPDGSSYKGTVEIQVVNGVVGLEWKTGDNVAHGQGLLVGKTLGVAVDNGLAVYRMFGQAEGQSLIGLWCNADSSKTNAEVILVGNADMTSANIDPEPFNGRYLAQLGEGKGEVEGTVTVSGKAAAKSLTWNIDGETTRSQGLAVGDGFAVLTPTGLAVFGTDGNRKDKVSLVGRALSGDGETSNASLNRTK